MERGRYLLANMAILGIIALAAVMIYVGVGVVDSAKTLALAIIFSVLALLIIGMVADAAINSSQAPAPKGWIKCDSDWVEKHGRAACATSPKIVNRVGRSHYHPAD